MHFLNVTGVLGWIFILFSVLKAYEVSSQLVIHAYKLPCHVELQFYDEKYKNKQSYQVWE
jgi:hypothetical protein